MARAETRYCKGCGKYLQDHYTLSGKCWKCMENVQDQLPNFRGEDGKFYLCKCYKCKKYRWESGPVTDFCPVCGWVDPDKQKDDSNDA